jgi:TetR/AcrR family transcriptional repressor of nem operon
MAIRSSGGDTASAILDVAERLVQTRGFNAFSYADVAAELGITKPALHYHFAGKAELGEALLGRYVSRFYEALQTIDDSGANAAGKLQAYADLYARVLSQNRMCLCGMLAADYQTLPEPMRQAVIGFFDHNEVWLTRVIEEGQTDGTVLIHGTVLVDGTVSVDGTVLVDGTVALDGRARAEGGDRDIARMIIGTLEGAMLVARTYGEPERFASSARRLLADLTTSLDEQA